MTRESVIEYDMELPYIPGRLNWERPTSYLVKDKKSESGYELNESGRRPSDLLLIEKIREVVDKWRDENYPGVSEVTHQLFHWWFEEEHDVPGIKKPFHYYFCQREAIETLIYLVEVEKIGDVKELIEKFGTQQRKDLLSAAFEFQTSMIGTRQIKRYIPEAKRFGTQDLPPEDLIRFAFRMATGSGKTWVMAMAIVWSFFHKKLVPDSPLTTNFLIIAPNIIVYQRLEKDFADNKIFRDLPLIPPELRNLWNLKVILRGDSSEPERFGNLFLTNIHQIYESRDKEWTPENAIERLLGRKPRDDLATGRSMLERIKSLDSLITINDEAHHVHDEELEWHKTLISVHKQLPRGMALWLDFSATPKDENKMFFPWTICSYPLAQAVEDRIIKAPVIVTKEDDPRYPGKDPDKVTKTDVIEKYGFWIGAAVSRWKEHNEVYQKLGTKPVLFIMTEITAHADKIAEHLIQNEQFGFKESDILVIHTNKEGIINKGDLDKAREAARDVDDPKNKIKVIVSVLMLREGWDVRNVSIVLGLRPFTAKSEILPEQVIGRGLRLMQGVKGVIPGTQTLEVLGTKNLLDTLRSALEAEGVGVTTERKDPPKPIIIQPIQEKVNYDIGVPSTKPVLTHYFTKLSEIKPQKLNPIFEEADLEEKYRMNLKMEFATPQVQIGTTKLETEKIPIAQVLIGSVTKKVIFEAKLTNIFHELVPVVTEYLCKRCFGREVDIDDVRVRSFLQQPMLQDAIAKYLAREISELTVERKELEFDDIYHNLSDTKPFSWSRNLIPFPLECEKTIFNYVATYNNFERRFAEFLDNASDIRKFAALGTTEQGDSGTQLRVDYLKSTGAIGFYHPDFIVIQKKGQNEINWIIETKGRVWKDTEAKDEAITYWCNQMSVKTGHSWKFKRVNQKDFEKYRTNKLETLLKKI